MAGLKQETIFVTFLSGSLWEHGAVEGLNKAREMILFSVLAHWVVPLVWCCITMSFFGEGVCFLVACKGPVLKTAVCWTMEY